VSGGSATLKFLDAPNGSPDDLKKILGIGAVLEEKLNDMGIYHYSQIAEFSNTDIENINTHLNFPGRIERDEWIPQAQDMVKGGEGRKLKYLDAPEGEKDDLKLISGVGPVLEDKLNERDASNATSGLHRHRIWLMEGSPDRGFCSAGFWLAVLKLRFDLPSMAGLFVTQDCAPNGACVSLPKPCLSLLRETHQ